MPFELLHFRDSDKILEDKHMTQDVLDTMMYIDDALYGTHYKSEIFRQVLDEMGWVGDNGSRRILDGRRYLYKGFKKGVALEGNICIYTF